MKTAHPPRHLARLAGLVAATLLATTPLVGPSPARADEGTRGASLALLSLLGAAPAFATDRMAFGFGIGLPALGGIETTAFRGLPGAPSALTFTSWSVSPALLMNGRWAAAQVAFDLHFGGDESLGDGLVADHSFGFRLMYHSGFNVLGFVESLSGELSLSIGPLLNVGIGPFWSLRGPEGEARYGHIGLIQLAPSIATSLIIDPMSVGLMVGYIPGRGLPWNVVEASAGRAKGAYAGGGGVIESDNPQDIDAARRSLAAIQTTDAWLLTASIAFHLYRADEPFLTLGARLTWRRHSYRVARGGFADDAHFNEEELRAVITLGIGAPASYSWTGGS